MKKNYLKLAGVVSGCILAIYGAKIGNGVLTIGGVGIVASSVGAEKIIEKL